MKTGRLKIAAKLTLFISIILIFVIVFFVSYTRTQTLKLANKDASVIAQEFANHYGSDVLKLFQSAMSETTGIAESIESIVQSDDVEPSRDLITLILKNWFIRSSEKSQIYDTWINFEPNAFDNKDEEYAGSDAYGESGAYSTWIYDEGNGVIGIYPSELSGDPEADTWYTAPRDNGTITISDIYEFEYSNGIQTVATIAEPLYDIDNNFIGVVGCDFEVGSLHKEISAVQIYDNGFLTLVSEGGTVVSTKNETMLGKDISEFPWMTKDIEENIRNGKSFNFTHRVEGIKGSLYSYSIPLNFKGSVNRWSIIVSIPKLEINSMANSMSATVMVIGFIILIFTVLFIILFARSITAPLKKAVYLAEAISKGNLATVMDLRRGDELGDLAEALNSMRENLSDILSQIKDAANQVASGSKQISSSSYQISSGANEQAASTEEISSSMEELVSNIIQNTDNANRNLEITGQAGADMGIALEQVNKTASSMETINEKISLIQDIARNTNMLALNAAIEAARAGEAGKGFAVVASEVRKLAETSQKAAVEITSEAEASVLISQSALESMNSVAEKAQKSAELTKEVALASAEQNTGADQINNAILQFDSVIQQNVSASEELSAMSEELESQAQNMIETISFFNLE